MSGGVSGESRGTPCGDEKHVVTGTELLWLLWFAEENAPEQLRVPVMLSVTGNPGDAVLWSGVTLYGEVNAGQPVLVLVCGGE